MQEGRGRKGNVEILKRAGAMAGAGDHMAGGGSAGGGATSSSSLPVLNYPHPKARTVAVPISQVGKQKCQQAKWEPSGKFPMKGKSTWRAAQDPPASCPTPDFCLFFLCFLSHTQRPRPGRLPWLALVVAYGEIQRPWNSGHQLDPAGLGCLNL